MTGNLFLGEPFYRHPAPLSSRPGTRERTQ